MTDQSHKEENSLLDQQEEVRWVIFNGPISTQINRGIEVNRAYRGKSFVNQ